MASPLFTCIIFSIFVICHVTNGEEKRNRKQLGEKGRFQRDARVSWKECDLNQNDRQDCGFYGVSEELCYERECCWGESNTEGIPWCFHSKPTVRKVCSAATQEKIACGFYGIRKEQCLAMDCCWQPSAVQVAPWCYYTKRLPVYEGECGVPAIPPNMMSRIVGGDDAKPHSWPWQASLQVNGEHWCGASLINDQWIITAAHCDMIFTSDNYSIVLGLHSQSNQDVPQQTFFSSEFFSHKAFGTQGFQGLGADITVAKLDRPVDINDYISPVCLMEPGKAIEEGRHAYATGWGRTRDYGEGGEMADKLQQVMVPIMSNEQCNAFPSYAGKVDDNMVCTGYEEGGKGTCRGDSGGPLVIYEDGHWTMVGVTSWTFLCAGSRDPEVYCRVSRFTKWIEEIVAEHKE